MMTYAIYGVLSAILCLCGQTFSQSELCVTRLMYGGSCVDLKQECPEGTTEFDSYSNYVGCGRVDRKCCAFYEGQVRNPNGITVPPPVSESCGIGSLEPESRILDGVTAGQCNVPFAAAIRSLLPGYTEPTMATTSYACPGVFISRKWMITHSMCIISAGDTAEGFKSKAVVVAGEYNVTGPDLDPLTGQPQEQVIRASEVYIHPDYKYRSQAEIVPFNDTIGLNSHAVALVKLADAITGPCAGVACLPDEDDVANKCSSFDECFIYGWGFSTESFDGGLRDDLLIGQVRLTSSSACDVLTQKMSLQSNRPAGTTCQSPIGRNTDSCLGDEGGAVLCAASRNTQEQKRWYVRGVTPFNMCINGRFNLFVTDIAPYLGWIRTTMASSRG